MRINTVFCLVNNSMCYIIYSIASSSHESIMHGFLVASTLLLPPWDDATSSWWKRWSILNSLFSLFFFFFFFFCCQYALAILGKCVFESNSAERISNRKCRRGRTLHNPISHPFLLIFNKKWMVAPAINIMK